LKITIRVSITIRMEHHSSIQHYLSSVKKRAFLPEGFTAASTSIFFIPREMDGKTRFPMNISLILCREPTEAFAGVFTKNAFPGAPVILGKSRMQERFLRGILINNKVANVCAENGVQSAENILAVLAQSAGGKKKEFLSASTGVIGWRLPEEEIKNCIPDLVLQTEKGKGSNSLFEVSKGIMTTDAYPKVREAAAGEGKILGTAKGAGMIEPNMGTMLAFIVTDIAVPRNELRNILSETVEKTFNCISIDGDQSTSDMVICMSSGKKKGIPAEVFRESLYKVCRELAEDVVRNGEGTGHVVKTVIKGAPDFISARELGKGVINSPLVKTAVFGNDPNVGRILMAVGDIAGSKGIDFDPLRFSITLGEEKIFTRGCFALDSEKETRLGAYLKLCSLESKDKKYPVHNRTVDITIDLGKPGTEAVVYGSDLSYDYVRVNADYRT